ncbi:MAG TPA: hypothetical protein VGG72_28010 [Bryobacteraceae bacterium]|jgi:hypothetical protein
MKNLIFVLPLAVALTVSGQGFRSEPLANPSAAGSIQPNWSASADGGALLSWLEPGKDGEYSLRYALRKGPAWSEARTVIAGRHFFRHPAEAPEVIQVSGKFWLAHWVEMPKESSDAEYIYVSSSVDGTHWSAPLMANRDRSEVQHGLVSMAASGPGEVSLFWLETPKGDDGPGYLMHTVVDASGKAVKEERLDDDVCDCCPTAVARTAKGLIVAYRDHTPDNIRDIAVLRLENGSWSPSKIVHADYWRLDACPVNAASVAAKGDHVALAWFTGVEPAKVQVIFSDDGGTTLGKPIVVSTGAGTQGPALGNTSLALADDGGAIISWLERTAGGDARLLVREVSAAGVAGPAAKIAEGGKTPFGYPRVFHSASGTFIAWGGGGKLETAQLRK